jgi:hypothetical protein
MEDTSTVNQSHDNTPVMHDGQHYMFVFIDDKSRYALYHGNEKAQRASIFLARPDRFFAILGFSGRQSPKE